MDFLEAFGEVLLGEEVSFKGAGSNLVLCSNL
jgi:hypothetical protein